MLVLALAVVAQTPQVPSLTVSNGKSVQIRSFDVGLSDDIARLKKSNADLVIVRFTKWNAKSGDLVKALQRGAKGRRAVLLELPVLGASPKNGVLWRSDWDANLDGQPDEDAPSWLRPRNKDGFYPLDTSNQTLRNRVLGRNGLLATVTKAGFDGVVVSSVEDASKKPGFDARFITDLAQEGRKLRPGFAVFMRDPGNMMDFQVIRLFLDGFIADGLFFGREEPNQPSDKAFVDDSVKRLEWAAKRLKVVLSVAYTSKKDQIAENNRLAKEHRFIPLALPKRLE